MKIVELVRKSIELDILKIEMELENYVNNNGPTTLPLDLQVLHIKEKLKEMIISSSMLSKWGDLCSGDVDELK
jgi:hypothetical protein